MVLKLATGLKWVQAQHAATPAYMPPDPTKGKKILEARYELGERNSAVFMQLERIKTADVSETGFKLRLEFNPRKLGIAGTKKLNEVFTSTADVPFKFGHFLAEAWITRLDVALDFAGFHPADVIVTATGQGTVIRFNGADGALETIQVHSKKKIVQSPKKVIRKPVGPLIVKLYDRNRERQAHGKPAPYDAHQVTRLERTMAKKNAGGSKFANLLGHQDPFKKVKLSLAPACSPADVGQTEWLSYCAAVGAGGPKLAASLIADPATAEVLGKAYAQHPSNLMPFDPWAGWKQGVARTGLDLLIKHALTAQTGA